MGLDQHVLHYVARIDPPLNEMVHPQVDHSPQRGPMPLEQAVHRRGIPGAGLGEQLLRFLRLRPHANQFILDRSPRRWLLPCVSRFACEPEAPLPSLRFASEPANQSAIAQNDSFRPPPCLPPIHPPTRFPPHSRGMGSRCLRTGSPRWIAIAGGSGIGTSG